MLTDVAKYIFKSALNDTISCNVVSIVEQDEVESGTRVNIAKPPHIRSTVDTDGEEVNGEIITYAPDELLNQQGTRKREFESNGGTVTLFEKIDPPYTADETIIAASVQASGVAGIRFQDLNVQARRWVNIEPRYKYFVIRSIHRDVFQCYEWDFTRNDAPWKQGGPKLKPDGVTLVDDVDVAKPTNLKGTRWSNAAPPAGVGTEENPDGVEYVVDGSTDDNDGEHNARIATRDSDNPNTVENQEITPPWFDLDTIGINNAKAFWSTVIRAVRVDEGTGAFRNGIQAIWQDTNDGGHAFAEKFS